ncbi:MAG: type II toxin-antitoxin system RelE/ParE family toxin [Candidatus Yanofskybacteria bacterium]|nr:type II toxin-antitoxin system RelE/ParE family toxin [Candidatus Yanofskybacteria bacterium]
MNLESKWKIKYTDNAADDLRKLPEKLQRRIAEKMRFFVLSSAMIVHAKKLKDNKYGTYRLRVGDYRVIFDKNDKTKELYVLKIGKRDEVYK